jgi:hypothetical protein
MSKLTLNRGLVYDTHEIMKMQMGTTWVTEGSDPSTTTSGPIQQQQQQATSSTPHSRASSYTDNIGISLNRFYLDSEFMRTSSNIGGGENSHSLSILNNNKSIENVTSMKVGAFNFPNIPNPNGTSGIDYYYDQVIFMTITELPTTQGFLGLYGNYYFRFRVSNPNGSAVLLTPENDTYIFTQPLMSMDSFTMRFTKPQNFQPIPLPPDVITVQTVSAGGGYNPARFTVVGPYNTSIFGPVGPLVGGARVAVRIAGLITPDAGVNVAASDPQGMFVDNVLDATTFSISSLNHAALASAYVCTVYIKKNKIAVDFVFTSLESKPTNFITPVI